MATGVRDLLEPAIGTDRITALLLFLLALTAIDAVLQREYGDLNRPHWHENVVAHLSNCLGESDD